MEKLMQRKVWMALAAAGMIAAPLAAQAGSLDEGTIVLAQAGGGAGGAGGGAGGAAGGGAGGAAGGGAGGAAGGSAGAGDSGGSGGSEGSSSAVSAPGQHPPGQISPGAPSSAVTGADVQSGAAGNTNPTDAGRLGRGSRTQGGTGTYSR
jgi:hypothetical protein